MMPRACKNWLQSYREYTAESEAPDSYHLWVGLSILASAIRRNLWIDQNLYPIFPNLYVILVAPAGKIGKSTVIRLGRTILQAVDEVELGPDSVTREELIKLMAKAGKDKTQAALTIHSTELSSLIDQSGLKMVQFLTDIYDCDYKNPHGWRYSTKHQGRDIIKNPVLNLLAGTIPNWVSDSMPVEATTHGFTSRTIFVYEDTPRFSNPFPGEISEQLVNDLSQDIIHIASLEGPFEWSNEAREFYESWYGDWQTSPPDDYRIEGFHWRKRIHILKVALLLHAAESDTRILEARDLKAAEAILTATERNMPKTFAGVGKYEFAPDLARIYKQILQAGDSGIPISSIYDKNYMVGDKEQVWKIIQTLQSMKRISLDKKGGELVASPIGSEKPLSG